LLIAVATALALLLVGGYVQAGGRSYHPQAVANPCLPPPPPRSSDRLQLAEEVVLDIVQRAACTLGVHRERLALALLSADSTRQFEQQSGIPAARIEAAVRAGARQALTDASHAGTITGLELTVLREGVDVVPFDQVLDVVRGNSRPCRPVPWKRTSSTRRVADQIALIALVRAACAFGTPPEDLAIALSTDSDLRDYKRQHKISDSQFEDVVRRALKGGVSDADKAGDLNGFAATALRFTIGTVPISTLLDMLHGNGFAGL